MTRVLKWHGRHLPKTETEAVAGVVTADAITEVLLLTGAGTVQRIDGSGIVPGRALRVVSTSGTVTLTAGTAGVGKLTMPQNISLPQGAAVGLYCAVADEWLVGDVMSPEVDAAAPRVAQEGWIFRNFTYATASPHDAVTVPPGQEWVIRDVLLDITTGFDGTSPSIDIGNAGTADGYLPTANIGEVFTALYGLDTEDRGTLLNSTGKPKLHHAVGSDVVRVTLTLSGATQGAATLWVRYLRLL